jgi:hypothetical protein
MVSKEEAKRFLSKINPFVQKLPEIADKVSKLEDDKEFQKLLGRLGTIGGLFSIGLYLFDKTLDHFEDTEKTYYSLINRTAISVAKNIIQEADKITIDSQENEEILEQMMKIYSFKETDKEQYEKWNGLVPYEHPLIQDFKEKIIQIIKEGNSKFLDFDFATEFDIKFNNEIKPKPKFLEYQKQKSLDDLSEARRAYFKWIIDDLDKPNPVDEKRATEYYVKSRAFELKTKDELNQRGYWNITDVEAEEICKNKSQWEINDFLKSNEKIKLVAAPFGTGKTSFAKYATRDIITKNLLGQSKEEGTWIPIYIPLNQNIHSIYREGVDIVQDLNEIIKPDKENVLLICDGIDEYPDPNDIVSLKDRLLKIGRELDPGTSISQLKIIFTTRLEAGLPDKLGIRKFIRLLPFTSDQVTEFFANYGHTDLTFEDIRKYGLQEKKSYSYSEELLKPLFCWMFAISFRDLQITKDVDVGIARFILYSTFIHSILEGRYKGALIEVVKEKWILRKIAALKSIYQELYEEDLQKLLLTFIEKKEEKKEVDPIELFIKGEQKKNSDSDKITLHTVITSFLN